MARLHPSMVSWGVRMGFMAYGWDAGVLGGLLQTSAFISAMRNPNTTTLAMIVAAFLLASWLGCVIVALPWSDRIGRRHWIMLGAATQILGTVICVSSYSYGQFIAGRVIIGIGNGFIVSAGPVYVAEVTPLTRIRGPLVGVLMGFACTGTACAYWVDFGFIHASGNVVWRFPVGFQIFWCILVLVLVYPNGDTPRWYYLRGRDAEGYEVLKQLYPSEEAALQCQSEIVQELREETHEKLLLSNLIVDKSPTQAMRRIRDGIILVAIAYLMGTNMIFYYMTTIFQVYIGLAATTASICSGAATTLLAIGVFLGSYFCESFGRRTWLLWGSALCSFFLIAFTILLSYGNKKTSSACAAMLFGWIAVFSPTWAPMPYIYISESMPLRHRHTGVGLGMSSQWLMAFLTVYAGPIAIERVGWKTWIWFDVFNVIGIPYVYFFIRETRGHTLEDVNHIFDKNHALARVTSSGENSTQFTSEKNTALQKEAPVSSSSAEKIV